WLFSISAWIPARASPAANEKRGSAIAAAEVAVAPRNRRRVCGGMDGSLAQARHEVARLGEGDRIVRVTERPGRAHLPRGAHEGAQRGAIQGCADADPPHAERGEVRDGERRAL